MVLTIGGKEVPFKERSYLDTMGNEGEMKGARVNLYWVVLVRFLMFT